MGRPCITKPSFGGFYNSGGIFPSRVNGVKTKAYQLWENMKGRTSNSSKDKNASYLEVTVCDEWKDFQVFAKWFQDHVTSGNYTDGYHLDKDFLSGSNKQYSPDTCVFIPREINNVFVKKTKTNGCFGVHKSKSHFEVKTNFCERKRFKTEQDALDYYNSQKKIQIADIVNRYESSVDKRVIEKLRGFLEE